VHVAGPGEGVLLVLGQDQGRVAGASNRADAPAAKSTESRGVAMPVPPTATGVSSW
jgi:hypothetical protein